MSIDVFQILSGHLDAVSDYNHSREIVRDLVEANALEGLKPPISIKAIRGFQAYLNDNPDWVGDSDISHACVQLGLPITHRFSLADRGGDQWGTSRKGDDQITEDIWERLLRGKGVGEVVQIEDQDYVVVASGDYDGEYNLPWNDLLTKLDSDSTEFKLVAAEMIDLTQ